MIEYHVDAHLDFQYHFNKLSDNRADRKLFSFMEESFGGNRSVRLKEGEKIVISFGHAECIFKQALDWAGQRKTDKTKGRWLG